MQGLFSTTVFVAVSAFLGVSDATRVMIGALVFFAVGVVVTLVIYGRKGT